MIIAGIRRANDEIEKEGLKLTRKALESAHIKVYLGANNDKSPYRGIDLNLSKNDLVVINKSDLKKKHNLRPNISISLKKEKKLKFFENKLEEKIRNIISTNTGAFLNKKRQKNHLIDARNSLEKISGKDLEIISIHIREALRSLDNITRETDNEEVLGIIFGKFCIGK